MQQAIGAPEPVHIALSVRGSVVLPMEMPPLFCILIRSTSDAVPVAVVAKVIPAPLAVLVVLVSELTIPILVFALVAYAEVSLSHGLETIAPSPELAALVVAALSMIVGVIESVSWAVAPLPRPTTSRA